MQRGDAMSAINDGLNKIDREECDRLRAERDALKAAFDGQADILNAEIADNAALREANRALVEVLSKIEGLKTTVSHKEIHKDHTFSIKPRLLITIRIKAGEKITWDTWQSIKNAKGGL
jgi:hypothetical protein